MKRHLAILLLMLSCMGMIGCGRSGAVSPVQGDPAPGFRFKDQSGRQYSLVDFRGKVVLVNFWATWCPPCLEEMPSIEQMQQRMAKAPLAILALSVDDSWGPVNQFMKQNGFTLPVYSDFDKRISTLYGTSMYPETYVVDKRGKVAYKVVGATDWMSSEMLKFLDVLIAEGV